MSRTMHADQAAAFRAVIAITYPAWPECPHENAREESTSTRYAGPYATIGAARAAATRESREARRWYWRPAHAGAPQPVVSVQIERSSITWEPVAGDE